MQAKEKTGSVKVGAAGRKPRRKSSKKRSQCAPVVPNLSVKDGDGDTNKRYHATSFTLLSGPGSIVDDKDVTPGLSQDKTNQEPRPSDSKEHSDTESEVFPFQNLPDVCKLKIFSYFSNVEKAKAMYVCRDWYCLMKTPGLWDHVSFSTIPLGCYPNSDHSPVDFDQCYDCYKCRVYQFTSFLCKIKPVLHSLEFKFDFADMKEKYMQCVNDLFLASQCHDLHFVHMNWKETPPKPYWLADQINYSGCEEFMQTHRHRQRIFAQFFDHFTVIVPNITTLIMPFGWSEKIVEFLGRLKNLHSLVLEKYFVFQTLNQNLLTQVLQSLPGLRKLMLEVWTPSGQGLLKYSLSSDSIDYLDISQSRGFYVKKLDLPKLKDFKVARHPWNGPLVMAEHVNLPCIYEVLVKGTPNLKKINDHYLEEGWQDEIYPTLEEVLKAVCSCKNHKRRWALC